MSKITPKNLSYDSTLPPFLQRLQQQNTSLDDRHEYTIARPKKSRTAEDIADDDPVFFNEETGETLTKSEWEAREVADEEAEREREKEVKDSNDVETKEEGEGEVKDSKEKEKVAAIGANRKRKVGKIIGGDEEGYNEVKAPEPRATVFKASNSGSSKETRTEGKKNIEKSKSTKKGKKIKLSFDD